MESLLEKIEQEIECLEPGTLVLVSDILREVKAPKYNREIELATIMLLQKYGINYRR